MAEPQMEGAWVCDGCIEAAFPQYKKPATVAQLIQQLKASEWAVLSYCVRKARFKHSLLYYIGISCAVLLDLSDAGFPNSLLSFQSIEDSH
jgi:hypothetical protein